MWVRSQGDAAPPHAVLLSDQTGTASPCGGEGLQPTARLMRSFSHATNITSDRWVGPVCVLLCLVKCETRTANLDRCEPDVGSAVLCRRVATFDVGKAETVGKYWICMCTAISCQSSDPELWTQTIGTLTVTGPRVYPCAHGTDGGRRKKLGLTELGRYGAGYCETGRDRSTEADTGSSKET